MNLPGLAFWCGMTSRASGELLFRRKTYWQGVPELASDICYACHLSNVWEWGILPCTCAHLPPRISGGFSWPTTEELFHMKRKCWVGVILTWFEHILTFIYGMSEGCGLLYKASNAGRIMGSNWSVLCDPPQYTNFWVFATQWSAAFRNA